MLSAHFLNKNSTAVF